MSEIQKKKNIINRVWTVLQTTVRLHKLTIPFSSNKSQSTIFSAAKKVRLAHYNTYLRVKYHENIMIIFQLS